MRFDRHKARLVAERDLRDATGDLRLILAMVGLSLAIPIASGIGLRALAIYGGGINPIVERLSIVGAFFVVFLPSSYSLVLALESFVGERERSTLEVLLSTPTAPGSPGITSWTSAPGALPLSSARKTWRRRRPWPGGTGPSAC